MNGKIDIALTLDFDLIDYPTDDIIYQVSSNQHQNVSFQRHTHWPNQTKFISTL